MALIFSACVPRWLESEEENSGYGLCDLRAWMWGTSSTHLFIGYNSVIFLSLCAKHDEGIVQIWAQKEASAGLGGPGWFGQSLTSLVSANICWV